MTNGLDKKYIPKHIAIIMDGNRRWARAKHLPDLKGHEAGSEALECVVEAAEKFGVEVITVYALSTENLRERAKREIFGLFALMQQGYNTKLKRMMGNGVKVTVLGELWGLPDTIKKIINEIKKTHIKSESIKLNIALNYGGKKELIDAVKDIIKEGVEVNKVNEQLISRHLYTNGIADPELVIRTGGRVRLSNFLLWQTAYSELYFTKTLWPDFDGDSLKKAITWYQNQKRNFGK